MLSVEGEGLRVDRHSHAHDELWEAQQWDHLHTPAECQDHYTHKYTHTHTHTIIFTLLQSDSGEKVKTAPRLIDSGAGVSTTSEPSLVALARSGSELREHPQGVQIFPVEAKASIWL